MSRCGALLLAATAAACAPTETELACDGEACSVPTSDDALLDALEGHDDVVAQWLRDNVDAAGRVSQDAPSLLDGIGAAMECDRAARETYVVLSNPLVPKAVVAHCADSPADASRLLTIFEPNATIGDLDAEHVRMAAWDSAAGRYRRYQFAPHPAGELGVVAEPDFCADCHGFAEHGWAPIMSEMTNPWARWHAEPDFASVLFDEAATLDYQGPTWDWLTEDLDSASRLEPIVRAAMTRVTDASALRRTEPSTVEGADAMLRPVFCDDTFNYVSEAHESGELDLSAAIDPMIRRALEAADPDIVGAWAVQEQLKLPAASDEADAIRGLPVRSTLGTEAEATLLSRMVLAPIDLLRVRALDWTHPVGSSLRCSLYEDGFASWSPASGGTTAEAVRELYDVVMTPLAVRDLGDDVVLAVADGAGVAIEDLGEDDRSTLSEWNDAIEAHLERVESTDGRQRLQGEVQVRGCIAASIDPTMPDVPGFDPAGC
jgi:hypothetical protein